MYKIIIYLLLILNFSYANNIEFCAYKKNINNLRYITYGYNWPNATIEWWYNPTNQYFSTEDMLQAISEATSRWEATGKVKFIYMGITDQNLSNEADDKVVIGWLDEGTFINRYDPISSAIGATWANNTSIIDAEIALKEILVQDFPLRLYVGLLTHELGHILGLNHSDTQDSVMSATPYNSLEYQRTLQEDDINAIKSLYPDNFVFDKKKILSILFDITDGINWSDNTNWLVGDPCDNNWFGITCNANNTIVGIDLSNNRLFGNIPNVLGQLNGLTQLSLSNNRLTGEIPDELVDLKNLTTLNLDYNQNIYSNNSIVQDFIDEKSEHNYQGIITTNVNETDVLITFYYSTNGDSWTDNTNWLVGNPCDNNWQGVTCNSNGNIIGLNFYQNNLTGSIPNEIGELTYLNTLDLMMNQLTGTIPNKISELKLIETLNLSYNQLTGAIPYEIGNLSNLRTLWIQHNQLYGNIPNQLINLTNLTSLYLADNYNLYSNDSNIQAFIGEAKYQNILDTNTWKNEQYLVLLKFWQSTIKYNIWKNQINWTSGDPCDNNWYGVTCDYAGHVTGLSLSNNNLNGSIPSEIGKLSFLKNLNLSHNFLGGLIPSEIVNLKNLNFLNFNKNIELNTKIKLYTDDDEVENFIKTLNPCSDLFNRCNNTPIIQYLLN